MLNYIKSLTLLAVIGSVASAQDRGAIRGTITDQSGAAVPEAAVGSGPDRADVVLSGGQARRWPVVHGIGVGEET